MKTHVCLPVGAARGSYQAGALAALAARGIRPEGGAAGDSVGALNAAMVATGQADQLVALWAELEDRDVFRGRFGPVNAGWSALRNRPMLDLQPLAWLMNDRLLGRELVMPLTVGTVHWSGERRAHRWPAGHRLRASDLQWIYTSCAIPLVFPTPWGADGGLVEPIPLRDTMELAEPDDRILVLSGHPVEPFARDDEPAGEVGKVVRAFEIMQAALVRKSIHGMLAINRLLESMGRAFWVDHRTGRRYVRYAPLVVAPARPLPFGMLDFTRSREGISLGMRDARAAVEAAGW